MNEKSKAEIKELELKIEKLMPSTKGVDDLQYLINKTADCIKHWDIKIGEEIVGLRDELRFYDDGGSDGYEKFDKCKTGTLTIIVQKLQS